MVRNKRIIVDGYPYFITNVTYRRDALLLDNIDLFWNAVDSARGKCEFDIFAWVVLPEHFHFIMYPGKMGISEVMKKIKQIFGENFRNKHRFSSGRIWQNGFHDHIIRNEKDLERHVHYIHYNPVKHGLVAGPFDYPHSSITRFKEYYPTDWRMDEEDIKGNFGE